MANKKILNERFAVRPLFVSFEISATELPKVIENQMNRHIKGRHQTRSELTHDATTHKPAPIQLGLRNGVPEKKEGPASGSGALKGEARRGVWGAGGTGLRAPLSRRRGDRSKIFGLDRKNSFGVAIGTGRLDLG
jgi:hypothetical protein